MTPVVSLRNLVFAWPGGPTVLDLDELEIKAGERIFLRGRSGSGKSTLLGLIAGVLAPQMGALDVLGHDFAACSGPKRDQIRARDMGVIFQMFNLLPFLSVIENVMLACTFSPERGARLGHTPETEARRLLARLGLGEEDLMTRRVRDLSVGQRQRVAAARALLGGPKLVLADEPTSALDEDARDDFLALLADETARTGAALLMVSHDGRLAERFDRALDLDALT